MNVPFSTFSLKRMICTCKSFFFVQERLQAVGFLIVAANLYRKERLKNNRFTRPGHFGKRRKKSRCDLKYN